MISLRTACTLIVLGCLLPLMGCSSPPNPDEETDKPVAPPPGTITFNNDDWADVLLKIATPDGYVRWDVLQSDHETRKKLMNYLGLLGAVSPENRPDLFASKDDEAAYWINAYNAQCVYWELAHGLQSPVPKTISDEECTLGDQKASIGFIVNVVTREYPNPRVWFALNCGARSSPPLRNTPYDGAVLEAQLADQAHIYLSDPRAVMRDGTTAKVCSLFFWYHVAIEKPYLSTLEPGKDHLLFSLQQIAAGDSPLQGAKNLSDMGFDWTLNRPPR